MQAIADGPHTSRLRWFCKHTYYFHKKEYTISRLNCILNSRKTSIYIENVYKNDDFKPKKQKKITKNVFYSNEITTFAPIYHFYCKK